MNDFNTSDYLTESQMKQIAIQSFRDMCDKQFSDSKNVERIISNSAFDSASKIVSEHYGSELQPAINKKVIDAINEISSFMVFKPADAWDRDSTNGFVMLKNAIAESKGLIEQKAGEIIKQASVSDAEEYVMDILRDEIADKLFRNSGE